MEKASTSSLRFARALVQSIGSRPSSSRLFTSPTTASPSFTLSATARQPCSKARCFGSSAFRKADVSSPNDRNQNQPAPAKAPSPPKPSSGSLMDGLADLLPSSQRSGDASGALSGGAGKSGSASTSPSASSLTGLDDLDVMKQQVDQSNGEYHFAVWAHKHNTHICVTKPNNDVIMSISCGHLGFRSAQRSSYDAAYQLGAYVCDKLYQNNWHKTIQRMRVSLRGFGPGREAITKILLGMEGRALRPTITKVSDSTRLKFGGTRSPNPRRLG